MKSRVLLAGFLSCLVATVPLSAANVTATVVSTFMPTPVTIVAGDSVTWSNVGGGFHNVVADDASFRCADGCDGSGGDGDASSAGWSFTRFFSTPGTVAYYCEIHGNSGGIGMSGIVTVLPVQIFGDGFESGNTTGWNFTTP